MAEALSRNSKTFVYTVLALIAFAANSILCRMALKDYAIDASSFTVVRLLSGAAMFVILLRFSSKKSTVLPAKKNSSWWAASMLFLYAITFSYAYGSLDTGTGALVLFGAVQLTMVFASIYTGNKLHLPEYFGVTISFLGLVYLVYPTITTPSIWGFLLMATSGVAWGLYSLAGRGSVNPLRDTAVNFKRTIPFAILLAFATIQTANLTLEGFLLAILSGAAASAIGYTIWYIALAGLSTTEAAVVQLSVPVIAAIGGTLFISELVTPRLVVASVLVLGGILSVVLGRAYSVKTSPR